MVLVFKHFLHWCSPKVSVTLMIINVQVLVAPMFTKFISTLMFINAQVLASPTFTNVQVLVPLMFTISVSYTDVHQLQCSSISSTDVHRLVVGARLRIHTGELDPPKCHSAHFSSFLLCKGFSTIGTTSTASITSAIS